MALAAAVSSSNGTKRLMAVPLLDAVLQTCSQRIRGSNLSPSAIDMLGHYE